MDKLFSQPQWDGRKFLLLLYKSLSHQLVEGQAHGTCTAVSIDELVAHQLADGQGCVTASVGQADIYSCCKHVP